MKTTFTILFMLFNTIHICAMNNELNSCEDELLELNYETPDKGKAGIRFISKTQPDLEKKIKEKTFIKVITKDGVTHKGRLQIFSNDLILVNKELIHMDSVNTIIKTNRIYKVVSLTTTGAISFFIGLSMYDYAGHEGPWKEFFKFTIGSEAVLSPIWVPAFITKKYDLINVWNAVIYN